MNSGFDTLDAELARWRDSGSTPRIWIRDDDATRSGAALDRLLDCLRTYDAPLLLAVVPQPCEPALADRLRDEALVRPAVHGFSHADHAPTGAKRSELTENDAGRSVDVVLAELEVGRRKLAGIFRSGLSGILVPPWNRMSPAVAARLAESGFTAVSLFGWKAAATTLPQINTHVDLIDWRGERIGYDPSTVAAMLADSLAEARRRGGGPIGVLTHHLVHDETAWSALEATLAHLSARGLCVASAEACLTASRPDQA